MNGGAVGRRELEALIHSLDDEGFVLVEDQEEVICRGAPGQTLDPARAALLLEHNTTIRHLLRLEAAQERLLAPIPVAERSDAAPLSLQQQRLWLVETLAGGDSGTYHIPTLLRLRGRLDTSALADALAALIARHESLRTVFDEVDGGPCQRILPPARRPLEIREVQFNLRDEVVRSEAARPFDLASGPLFRPVLLRHGPDDHSLLLIQHHLISDGWTIALLVDELAALYGGGAGALPVPKLQYADFAIWQRAAEAGGLVEPQLDYWREVLAGWSPLELPTDRPRTARPGIDGAHHHFEVPVSTRQALEALARRENTTLFVVLVAALQALLRIHTRQDDITLTTALAGRPHLDLHRLAGFFVNLVPLRHRFAGDPSFRTMLTHTDTALHEALSHQETPFEQLIKALEIPREGVGRTPLERFVVVLQSANEKRSPHFSGLDAELIPEADLPIAKFELTFSLQVTEQGISGRIEFSTQLYDRSTVVRLAEHYQRLLAVVAREPEATLTAGVLLTADDFERVVLAPNRTAAAYPRDQGLVSLFEARVDQTPDAVAVLERDVALTYAELDKRANGVARALVAAGVGGRDGAMVALCMERGAGLIGAILGILKAGAAYVPIDPTYPVARIRYMLDETGSSVFVLSAESAAWLGDLAGETCTFLILEDLTASPERLPGRAGGPDDLAYVCFTSGTTGKPKGVLIEQRSVVRLVIGTNFVRLGPDRRIALASNAVFDAVTFEIWGALLHGAALIVLDRETMLDPEALAARLEAERVDILWLTAALFDQMAAQRPDMFRHLDYLIIGGSALNPTMVRAVLTCPQGAPRHLLNGYGPTENTTFSTTHHIDDLPPDACGVPIGRPIANTTAYVLDPGGEPVPFGVVGELHVGGDGLCRGYLGDPERTAERLVRRTIRHPGTGQHVTERLYATGDLVHWRTDGTLEFIGRNDRQIKLRGYRVEPGEIVSAIDSHPSVLQAVVRPLERENGHLSLCAWYACGTGTPIEPAELRHFLETILPGYMVPENLIRLSRLPTNTSGKIDDDALPLPVSAPPTGTGDTTGADGEAGILLAIWRQVLRNESIGTGDDFFSAGGDSILSIEVVAKARERGLRLAPHDIFELRTIDRLAGRVIEHRGGAVDETPEGPPPLTPIQHWFFELGLPRRQHFNQAFLVVPPGEVSADRLAWALGRLVARHDALRLRFQQGDDGRWEQHVDEAGGPAIAVREFGPICRARLQELLTEWQAGFDLAHGPIIAAAVSRASPHLGPRVFLAVHHLAVDIVSWRILLDELGRLLAEPATQLPPVTSGFRAWAHRLARLASSPEVAATHSYWQHALEASGGLDALPQDFPRGTARSLTVRLDAETTRALLQDCAEAYRTRTHELILAALVPALAVAGGQSRGVGLMLEGHGREDVVSLDSTSSVGWFTTRFPVHFALPEDAAQLDAALAISEVKAQLRAVPHNGLSYGILRASRDGDEDAVRLEGPEPGVCFNYLGQLDRMAENGWSFAPEPPGLMVSPANPQPDRLDVTACIRGGCFEARFATDDSALIDAWMENLAAGFIDRLQAVVDHCRGRSMTRLMAADAMNSGLPAEELENLLEEDGYQPLAVYPLTPLQEGLLFHSLHSPASDQYIVQFIWRCKAALEPEILREAWRGLSAEHAVLRTRFAWRELSHPVQIVEASVPLEWRIVDLSGLADAQELEAAIAEERASDRARGFDLGQPGLQRVTLMRLGATEWVLLWTHHHILLDGWCVSLLLDELGQRYARLQAGDRNEPTRPATRYEDYVAWLGRQERAPAMAFWRRELADFAEPTDIPVRRPGASFDAHVAVTDLGIARATLDFELTAKLGELARHQGVTLNAVIQLAWACLLAGYAGGSRDVVFGTVVSGRDKAFSGIERLIGLTASVVPVRAQLGQGLTVAAALRTLHATIEAASQHSHLSLADIQTASPLPAGAPLFHSVTVFENYPAVGAGNAALGASAPEVHDKTSFPLLLMVIPGARLQVTLHYDQALFVPSSMSAMLGHFANILAALAARPDGRVDDIELTSPEERRWLVEGCNATDHTLDPTATVVSLFEAQVRRTPEAIAAEDDAGQGLSYVALDHAANRLAHLLHDEHQARFGRSLAVDTAVGICLERGLGLIIAILGVLKAGGAYVPLDPDHPTDRLTFVTTDSECSLIVTDSRMAERLGQEAAGGLILQDAEPGEASAVDPAWSPPGAHDLAYILYTSGSTGRPKGAMIEHRSLVNRLLWMQATYPLDHTDRVLQKTPFSFDVSVWEFLWPLLTGARLVFARPDGHRDPAYLARFIRDRGITTLHFVPSMLRVFLEVVDVGRLSSLRRVFCSGEALPTELPRAFLEALPSAEMHNLYGPTEAAIDVSHHACSPDEADSVVPIGQPVWNTQLHVLDALTRPMPVGLPGELWIGGIQVGRGYLNRRELSAERFVPDPFGRGRLYRTGDLVRRRSDGTLDYLGRTDFQVKVRGVRIELGEIEAALEALPGVRQAIVVAKPLRGGHELVGYLAASPDLADDAAIRERLGETLVEAMVPTHFVRLDRLPLNSSGKVDRAALPDPERPVTAAMPEEAAPPIAAAIAEVFSSVLGVPVAAGEDFFEQGGHSLHAVRAVAQIVRKLGIEVPLSALFEHRNAAALARTLTLETRPGELAADIPVVDRSDPLPASFAQERMWLLHGLLADRSTYNVPLALRIHGPLDLGALGEALDGIIARHEILRTRLVARDGRLAQVIAPVEPLPLRLERTSEGDLEARLRDCARQPFDLTNEPPIRAHLLRLGPQEHVLLLNQHHVVTDGWSLDLLLRELGERYRCAALGDEPALPPPAVQYADLAAWERHRLAGPHRQVLVDYWARELADAVPFDLPTDWPRPATSSGRGGTCHFTLAEPACGDLLRLTARLQVTPFALVVAAWTIVLARWTGRSDFTMATPVANRAHPAQMQALGLFINTIVLRTRLAGPSETFADLASALGTTAAAALEHQDLPFDQLLDVVGCRRDKDRPPLTPVMVILQNAGDRAGFAAPGLATEQLPLDTGTAKFDLTLSLEIGESSLNAVIEYAADLFAPGTIEALADAYRTVLGRSVAAPETSVEVLLQQAPVTRADNGGHGDASAVGVAEAVEAHRLDEPARPRTLELVTSIWRDVLARETVPGDRNFFDLGGTSLDLMRVQARLAEGLGRDVPIIELFEHPTIDRLAAFLDQANDGLRPPPPIPAGHRRSRRTAHRSGRRDAAKP